MIFFYINSNTDMKPQEETRPIASYHRSHSCIAPPSSRFAPSFQCATSPARGLRGGMAQVAIACLYSAGIQRPALSVLGAAPARSSPAQRPWSRARRLASRATRRRPPARRRCAPFNCKKSCASTRPRRRTSRPQQRAREAAWRRRRAGRRRRRRRRTTAHLDQDIPIRSSAVRRLWPSVPQARRSGPRATRRRAPSACLQQRRSRG